MYFIPISPISFPRAILTKIKKIELFNYSYKMNKIEYYSETKSNGVDFRMDTRRVHTESGEHQLRQSNIISLRFVILGLRIPSLALLL